MTLLAYFDRPCFHPACHASHGEANHASAAHPATATKRTMRMAGVILAAAWMTFGPQTASAQIDCSQNTCWSYHQTSINGYTMFGDRNFAPVVDGIGRARKFYVHIPASYDTLADHQLMPTIFAFHGGGQDRMAMIEGKWGDDYFNQNIAFVIPLGEAELCSTRPNPKPVWMQPGFRDGVPIGSAIPANCDPATQQLNAAGDPITYWNTTLANTFSDVVFVENLRAMILDRFPKLNPNKVYATGFSSGGGMTLTLLCYRSTLFRGFSIVAKSLYGAAQRGDLAGDGTVDPNSMLATCGKSQLDAGHATGIATPNLWGYGIVALSPPPLPLPPLYARHTKPVVLFVGDRDDGYTTAEINDMSAEIRLRNNLTSGYFLTNAFMNSQADEAETERRIYSTIDNPIQPTSTFTRYLVSRVDDPAITPNLKSAGHAMPDADEPPRANLERMTSDFNYTDRTVIFFRSHADMDLNP